MGWGSLSRHGRRRRFLERYRFPDGLDEKLARARPELSAIDRARVLEGLRDWFRICQERGRRQFLAMPSRAVDEAWHEFILFTREYAAFCRGAFGRYLHHTPSSALAPGDGTLDSGLRATRRIACRQEGLDPESALALPAIFALDALVGVADRADAPDRGEREREPAAAGSAGYGGGAVVGCGGGGSDSGGGGWFSGGDGGGGDGGGGGGGGGGGCGGGGG